MTVSPRSERRSLETERRRGVGAGAGARSGAALALGLLALGCAREEPPPGSPPDFRPPRAISLEPARDTVVPGFDGDASVRFDEPLADPRGVERLFFGSPVDRFEIDPGRRRVSIRPTEGWREGVVYYLRIAPGVADLMRNRTVVPIELVFSTGPDVPRTMARGRLYDRVRGTPLQGAAVRFLESDSIPYGAITDTAGEYRLPALPPGTYRVFGFVDRNRNRRLDRDFEPYDSGTLVLAGPDDAGGPDLWLVEPDSTPPALVGGETPDSATVLLEFDEPLDPEQEMDSVRAAVRDEDGREKKVTRVRVGREEESPGPQAAAEVGAPPAPAAGAATAGRERDLRPLPSVFLRIELGEPLAEGPARISVEGVRNLRGLAGRADTTLVWTLPVDSLSAEPGGEAGAPR